MLRLFKRKSPVEVKLLKGGPTYPTVFHRKLNTDYGAYKWSIKKEWVSWEELEWSGRSVFTDCKIYECRKKGDKQWLWYPATDLRFPTSDPNSNKGS